MILVVLSCRVIRQKYFYSWSYKFANEDSVLYAELSRFQQGNWDKYLIVHCVQLTFVLISLGVIV